MRIFSITILLVLILTSCRTHDLRELPPSQSVATSENEPRSSNNKISKGEILPKGSVESDSAPKGASTAGNDSTKNAEENLSASATAKPLSGAASKQKVNQDLPQLATSGSAELILDHGYFQVSYSEKNRLPNWVSYHLRADNLKNKVAKRKNKFFADPQLLKIKKAFASPDDFDGDTYDRGHMAPSDDFAWDQKANDATFVMTNMAPQERALNRGSWKKLELTIRKWACTEGELRVVTGPILSESMARMSSQVPVPQKFFKVVLDETPPRKAIGFIYKQEDGKTSLAAQAMNLAAIEAQTGYKFFVDLPQNERKPLEIAYNLQDWVETDCLPGRKKRH
jgi:endonuclease G